MGYTSLQHCINDLEKNNQLIKITEPVSSNLEMAAIHLRVNAMGGPALLFQNVIDSQFQCASNLFGTKQRAQFIFRDSLKNIQQLIELKQQPYKILKQPFKALKLAKTAYSSLPQKNFFSKSIIQNEININQLPQIKHWPMDGGSFITLPQVYTEDVDFTGISRSNLGMYRVQLSGNNYEENKEIGLHYQLHRGIGVHHSKAVLKNKSLKVSIFVGGPPSHTFAAVMPLPENMSELNFAGALGHKRFNYFYEDGYCISADADFVITGEVMSNNNNKPEGPFGDHLGYYSLTHLFPVLKIHKVYHKKNAIWPFTVVGRPPQEDSIFGSLIHELAGDALHKEIPGLKDLNAVDAAGVHPLLLAVGTERYTPYLIQQQPSEILTIANHILGSGQLSMAKYVFITASNNDDTISAKNEVAFFTYLLEHINLQRDLHFYSNTTIDTLDYTGSAINQGSKLVLAAYGPKIRCLNTEITEKLRELKTCFNPQIALPGVLILQAQSFINYEQTKIEIDHFEKELQQKAINLNGFPLIVLVDDANFTAHTLNNWLWITFTRSNPTHDTYGINSTLNFKHFGCDNLIIDARIKPHHAPVLELDKEVEKKIDKLFEKGKSLYSFLKPSPPY